LSELMAVGQALTMSSREIAELVDSRHDSVKRTIERLVAQGVIESPPLVDFKNINNVAGQEYVFSGEQGKRSSIIVVAQLSPEFTARLVDRWQELEAKQAPQVPQTYSQALLEAGRLAQLAEEQAQQLALAAPKVNFFDKVVERTTLMTATQVAQKLGMSAIKLNKHLDELDVYSLNVKRARTFKQWVIDKGLGELKQTELGYSQPLFTTAGEAWIVERLTSEGVAC
jgi:phage regulator Rha-like protein